MSDRSIEKYTVEEFTDRGDSYEFRTTSGIGFIRSKSDVGAPLQPGDEFELETQNWSNITGLRVDGEWRFRLTDQDIEDEHARISAEIHRSRVELLEKNQEDWAAIEKSLPPWIRARLDRFHAAGGEKFRIDGWGYELAVARLAAAYAESDAKGEQLAAEMGATGNQVAFGRALAQAHLNGEDEKIAQSIAALSPITGSADYR